MLPYILTFAAGYFFGNNPASYLISLAVAVASGFIDPVKDWKSWEALPPVDAFPLPSVVDEPDHSSPPSLFEMADNAARTHGVEPRLFRALIKQESAWNPFAVSSAGAAGLTQLMPATAKSECGLEPAQRFDAAKNLDCGAYYFAKQLQRFGSVELALAAYNSGPARVARLGRVPRIRETQNYVSRITADYRGI